MTRDLKQRFEEYVGRNSLLTHDDRILLTVSGGVDSMVMLSLFAACGYRIGVAHCNFCLRGAESDEDEVLVAQTARSLGAEYHSRRFDTAAEMARTGESMEMAARRLRYAWFAELQRDCGYDKVAIAHHADDSVETFFINLFRGTGLRGLTGIGIRLGCIVRPMMFATRHDILDYATRHGIRFREDSSNRSTKYLLNKIRLGLIPRIREIRPEFTEAMGRNIARLTEAQQFIDSAVARIRESVIESCDGVDRLHVGRIDPTFPRNFVIYELLSAAYGFRGDVCDSLCRALDADATGRRFYSKEYVACIDRGTVAVSRIALDDTCEVEVAEDAVRAYCGNSVLHINYVDIATVEEYGVPANVAQIDASLLQFPLKLRRWQEGDRFMPFGMNGSKKVSDLLTDLKVPAVEKDRQFVLLSGEDIVWVVGRRIDDRYRLTDDSVRVMRITQETI